MATFVSNYIFKNTLITILIINNTNKSTTSSSTVKNSIDLFSDLYKYMYVEDNG